MFSPGVHSGQFYVYFKRAAGYPGDNVIVLTLSTLLGAALAWVIIRQVPGFNGGRRYFSPLAGLVPVLVMLYFFFYVWPWIAAGLFGGPQDNMYHYKLLATGGGGPRAIADFQRVFRRNLSRRLERG